jgi:DNA ligase (NAD+)
MNKTALQILQNSSFGAFAEQHQMTDENLKSTLQHSINQWNLEYQQGNPSVSDEFYDFIREFYQEYFGEIESHAEIEDSDERKVELPITAGSMNKCKTLDELKKWAKSKGFDFDTTEFIISPKYDGITLINDEFSKAFKGIVKTYTKGKDGFGLYVPNHYLSINNESSNAPGFYAFKITAENNTFLYSRGEAIMKRSVFEQKYSKEALGEKDGFENARNFVASRFVEKEPNSEILKDIDFIRFHLDNENFSNTEKDNMLNFCNKLNNVQIPYVVAQGSELTEASLKEFFIAWSNEYELDGLIIDINKFELRNRLGLETSTNNPCYARAYKAAEFDPEADTVVLDVINQVDKNGILNPVLIIKPIRLGGVTINRVYGKNHRFMCAYGIGIGSNLRIRRSGNVISDVVGVEGFPVIDSDRFKKIADKYFDPDNIVEILSYISENIRMMPAKDGILTTVRKYIPPKELTEGLAKWNDSLVDIVLIDDQNDSQQIQKIVSFFETIGAEGVSDGLIADLYHKGFRDVKEILSLTDTEILTKFDGWGEKKAINFITSIKKAIEKVDLPTLAHATGFFRFLGSKKLALVEKLSDMDWMPTLEELNKIEGYSDISSAAFINGFDSFWHFIEDTKIKVNIKKPKEILGNKMGNKNIVFTGIRDKELENWIEQNGGKIGSGVNKSTSILIMKEIGSGSSKESKAIELGIEIETLESFKEKYGA